MRDTLIGALFAAFIVTAAAILLMH